MQVLVSTKNMDRAEWLEWRRRGIGGSDAPAIVGVSRFKTRMGVWLEKTGQVEPEEPGEAAYWGQVLEEVVAREFCLRAGKKVQRRQAILVHPDYPFMITNLDRVVVGEKAGLECKTTSEFYREQWEDNRVPDEYVVQCQHYMAVTGFNKWYIAVLIGGNKFRWKEIPRDDELIGYLIKIEADFWRLVETRTPPEMDGSEACSELLNRLYPQAEPGKQIELPSEAAELIAQYEEAREQEAYWAERKTEAENKLKALLGEAEMGWVGGRRVYWQTRVSTRLDTKALKAEQPEIYERYARQSVYRAFSIK
jgi:putative phage-type endonuclease